MNQHAHEQMAEHTVRSVTAFRLDDDADIALAEAVRLLSPAEEARRAAFVFSRDRDRFARGRGFLRRTLGSELNLDPARVPLQDTPGAKPHVPGAPFDFNLSHSEDLAVLAINGRGCVGIDVEIMDRRQWDAEDIAGLARYCMKDAEVDAITSVPPEEQRRRFLEFWTAKEARMKVWGEGMSLHPRSIRLALSNGVATGIDNAPSPMVLTYVPLDDPRAVCAVVTANARPSG